MKQIQAIDNFLTTRHQTTLKVGLCIVFCVWNCALSESEFDMTVTPFGVVINGYKGLGGNVEIPDEMGGVKVRVLGESCFEHNNSVRKVTLPPMLEHIGNNAFSGCSNLAKIDIPDGVTNIGDFAFAGCSKMDEVFIGPKVSRIGDFAFTGCNMLEDIHVDANNPTYSSINGVLFDKNRTRIIRFPPANGTNTYTIPCGVVTIGAGAFYGNALSGINMNEDIREIEDAAFAESSRITKIQLSSKVSLIGAASFRSCGNLTTVSIPDGVGCMGDNSFMFCGRLQRVRLPNSITNIGKNAFAFCSKLTNFGGSLSNLSVIGEMAFAESGIVSLDLTAKGAICLESSAFMNSTELKSVHITSPDIQIGEMAFLDCTNLSNVVLTCDAIRIHEHSFENCVSLDAVLLNVRAGSGHTDKHENASDERSQK